MNEKEENYYFLSYREMRLGTFWHRRANKLLARHMSFPIQNRPNRPQRRK
jgi:hypothetical protein